MTLAARQNGLRPGPAPLHVTKAEAVAQWIRARILSSELLPGASLQQEEIARLLDVSSTPVREAFVTLEAEGYVERRPHRGAVVTRPPYDQIEEIREVRNNMERLAVERICAASDPDVLAPLADPMEEARQAVEANDPVRWQQSAFDFHHAIAVASGSRTILEVSTMLIARERRNLPVYEETMRRAHRNHEDLTRALEERDRKRALDILDEHARTFEETVSRARGRNELAEVRPPSQ